MHIINKFSYFEREGITERKYFFIYFLINAHFFKQIRLLAIFRNFDIILLKFSQAKFWVIGYIPNFKMGEKLT